MSDADSGSSAASTDDAGAISSQDAAGQQGEVIEVETEEGGASNTAEAVWVVESAKIFDLSPVEVPDDAFGCTVVSGLMSALSSGFSVPRKNHLTRPTAAVAGGGDEEAPDRVPKKLDRSLPPSFITKNNVVFKGEFVVNKEGEPTAEELANENLLKIMGEKCTDEQMNWLVWKCLGYRYNAAEDTWVAEEVFPKWKDKYPEPPDLLGVTRVYEKHVDTPVMGAVQALIRTIPLAHKRSIVEHLRPVGFTGLTLDELTPNRTRRAQATNFLIYFREQLWGYSLEELQQRRAEEKAKAAAAAEPPSTEGESRLTRLD
eukprot:jgi/Undpi1/13692/HiC_scaffold_9.g03346.m1